MQRYFTSSRQRLCSSYWQDQKTNEAIIIYSAVICLVKLAILIQLAQIFTPFKSKMYWTICIVSALTVMFYVACIVVGVLECIPREKIWKPSVPGTCINSAAAIVTSAVVNTMSDFVLFIIPLSRIVRLQMPKRKKWAVSAVFSTGFLWVTGFFFGHLLLSPPWQRADVSALQQLYCQHYAPGHQRGPPRDGGWNVRILEPGILEVSSAGFSKKTFSFQPSID